MFIIVDSFKMDLATFGISFLAAFILYNQQIHGHRVFGGKDAITILALENEPVNILCEQDMPMSYCSVVHPSGKRFSFSGYELNDGHCAIHINATLEDAGEWKCNIGRKTAGVEVAQKIQLRVVDKVAAVEKNVTAIHGKDITLECVTTQGFSPLRYCRFEPPNERAFSIDSAVNRSNPILGRYYFPQNKSLDRGDCAVTIRKLKYEDVGIWTCGAGLSDGKEYTDSIKLVVQGLYTMSTASATGVTFGALGIAVFLILLGFLGWRKRRFLGVTRRETGTEDNELGEMGFAREVPTTPHGSRRSSVSRSPHSGRRSPQASRVPTLVVQSPSEPGSSPLM